MGSAFSRVFPQQDSQQVFDILPSLLNKTNKNFLKNEAPEINRHQAHVDSLFDTILWKISHVYKTLRPAMEENRMFSHPLYTEQIPNIKINKIAYSDEIDIDESDNDYTLRINKRISTSSDPGYASLNRDVVFKSKLRKYSEDVGTISGTPEISQMNRVADTWEEIEDPATFNQSEILSNFSKLNNRENEKNVNKRESKFEHKSLEPNNYSKKLGDAWDATSSLASVCSAQVTGNHLSPELLSQWQTNDEPLSGSKRKRGSKILSKTKKRQGYLISDTLPVNISIMDHDAKAMLHQKKYNELVDELTNLL